MRRDRPRPLASAFEKSALEIQWTYLYSMMWGSGLWMA